MYIKQIGGSYFLAGLIMCAGALAEQASPVFHGNARIYVAHGLAGLIMCAHLW